MIIKCKVCEGSGFQTKDVLLSSMLGESPEACESCKGAGELEILVDPERSVTCKICNGKGISIGKEIFSTQRFACAACKGIGLLERPRVGSLKPGKSNTIQIPHTPRLTSYKYDVAVSFAGEDRSTVQQYCSLLTTKGLEVFYDEYNKVDLWGTDLYARLDEVYRKLACFCVIFISHHYKDKVWTNHERKSAQARALRENREYILPVKLDDTEIPGIPETLGYVDLRKEPLEEIVEMTAGKIRDFKSQNNQSVPTST
jgi:hypothetical protein